MSLRKHCLPRTVQTENEKTSHPSNLGRATPENGLSSNGSAKPDLLGRQERANSVAVDIGILGGGMPLSHSADGTELNDKSHTTGTRFSGIEVRERRVFLLWQQVNPLYDPGRRKSSSATRGNSPVTHRLG